ncbi:MULTISPECIES: DUF4021 domain-containing protein [Bacillus cereus group]|uniref:DUF4021 domain-containing protein n=2 Tax=Bacillus cereus group TaxID=86661 RepID=A0A0G8EQA9_BACCE|nr:MULTISPECIES: DUF4021 domain-containing protein [Bacillus cereus group]KAA0750248.1 DUF4021 domain-containing protein [Bacillus sp. AY3-1]KLA26448.1 hypothetical protein B4077_2544 [Bacillus cereus]MCP9279232.1 DUF4021 family protein [Bacillus wiedmannii]SCC30539.1 Uncharacterized protein BC05F1_02651 [Bacillus wiedmannii]
MNNSKKEKNDVTNNNVLGLDLDEQAMNGLYGMPETDIEEKDHRKKSNSPKI